MTGLLNETESRIWLDLTEHNTLDQLAELASSGKSYKDLMYNYRETRATELHNQIAQLRDELAAVKAKYDAADEALCCIAKTVNDTDIYVIESIDDDVAKVVRELKAFKDCVNKRFSTAGISSERDINERFDILLSERNSFLERAERAEKERDEALAKLAQSRMVMRDGGQLWEVFHGDGKTLSLGTMQYMEFKSWHKKDDNELLYSQSLYRRPITPSELQGWIATDAKPVGYVDPEFANRKTSDSVHCMITSVPFGGCTVPVYLPSQAKQ